MSHLKRVVELLDHFAKSKPLTGWCLQAPEKRQASCSGLLPKTLRHKVIASATLSANAPESRIVEEVLFLGQKAERAQELETVEVLATASAKGEHGVIDCFRKLLAALNDKRVRELVYAEGMLFQGTVCGNATLFSRPTP